jgi:aconitate decarboxylase
MVKRVEANGVDDRYTKELAAYAGGVKYDSLPGEVRDRVKYLILDGLGCGIHGSSMPWSEILTDAVVALGSSGRASAWGADRYVSADHAALLNGSYVQAFELDDYSRGGALHACALVLPAAFAAATLRGRVTGQDLIAATVAGFEVGNRVGKCLGATRLTTLGWHTGSVIGPIAAAAGAGNILGLDTAQMANAFGIAATQASGLMAAQFGSMVKRMHHGRASQSGLYGAVLASKGYTGIEAVFERPYAGYSSTFTNSEDGFDLEALVVGLGEDYRTLGTCVKPYACCAKIHVALDAVKDARLERAFDADEVAEVRVRCTKATMKKTGWVYTGTGSATEAQMNMSYGIAVMLLEGDAFVSQFREDLLTDPGVLELTSKIVVVHDEAFDALGEGRRHHIHVEVELLDGSVIGRELDYAFGSANRPMADEDIVTKYDKIVAGRSGSAEVVKTLVLELEALEDLENLQLALAEA